MCIRNLKPQSTMHGAIHLFRLQLDFAYYHYNINDTWTNSRLKQRAASVCCIPRQDGFRT